MILSADWHLTDAPDDAYRWNVFNELHDVLQLTGPTDVFILGDLTDKKDRHSAKLTNMLVDAFVDLHPNALSVNILMGNHDKALHGIPYWNLLNNVQRDPGPICFVWDGTFHWCEGGAVLLPFTDDPQTAWVNIEFNRCKAAFMHQPVKGAIGENGQALRQGSPMPIFPRGIKLYSGDIHTPQSVGRINYVGAPHPIKFGDSYTCRMLELNDSDYSVKHIHMMSPAAKELIEISSLDDLADVALRPGDQVKIRMRLDPAHMDTWPETEAAVAAWASAAGVRLSSTEALMQPVAGPGDTLDGDLAPHAMLDAFCANQDIAGRRADIGHDLLRAALLP